MDLFLVVLLVAAIVSFLFATLTVNARVNLVALGLMLVTIYVLLVAPAAQHIGG